MQYVIAIDVGGSTVKFGQFDLEGNLLKKWSMVSVDLGTSTEFLGAVADNIKSNVDDIASCVGFGFGVPGPVKNNVVMRAVNLGWEETDVARVFASYFDKDYIIKVQNDANIAALGESMHGAGKAYKDMVLFTLGTGIGGGIVVGGKVIEGVHGAGGEIGHIDIGMHDFTCNCGRKHCTETVASATGLRNLVNYYLNLGTYTSKIDKVDASAKFIIDAAKDGDAMALKIIDDMTLALAKTASIISNVTNPDVFVFGGGIAAAGNFIIDKIEAHFKNICFHAVEDTLFIPAILGNDAALYGCFSLVINHG